MAELYQLQEQEIPEAMTHLQDSHNNLKKVADYCEGLYLQVHLQGIVVYVSILNAELIVPIG